MIGSVADTKGKSSAAFGSLFTIFILSMEGVSNRYLIWVLYFAVLVFRLLMHRRGLKILRLPGGGAYVSFVTLGMLEGAIALVNKGTQTWPYCRDIIMVTQILIYWWMSVELAYSCQYDMTRFIRLLFLFFGGWCWYCILANLRGYLSSTSILDLDSEKANQWVLSLGVYLSIFKPPSVGKYYFSKGADRALSAGIMLAFLLAFSRTAMIMLACLLLFSETRHYGKMLKLVCMLMVAVGIAYELMPDLFFDFIRKILHSFWEINASRTSWTPADVVQNWRGFEVHEAQRYFSHASVWQKLFGEGFGKSLDVGGYAFLVTTEDSLPYLHNGYYTALMKLGAAGVILYFAFLAGFWAALGRGGEPYGKCLGRGVAACMFVSSIFVNGMYFGGASMAACCVCCWLLHQGADARADRRFPKDGPLRALKRKDERSNCLEMEAHRHG